MPRQRFLNLPVGCQRLAEHLVHVQLAIGRKPLDEPGVRLRIGQGLVTLAGERTGHPSDGWEGVVGCHGQVFSMIALPEFGQRPFAGCTCSRSALLPS